MKKNILTAEFSHETNTFVEELTTLLNFSQYCLLEDENAIKIKHSGKKTSIGSTYEMGEKYNWNVISAIEAVANPSGKLTEETFEYILGKILSKVQEYNNNNGPLSVILDSGDTPRKETTPNKRSGPPPKCGANFPPSVMKPSFPNPIE